MDPQSLQPYVTLGRDIITGLSALIAASVAIWGLRTWKKQLKGKTEYELAHKLLRSVYKVRNAIAAIRNPFMSSGEIAQALKEAGVEPPPISDPDRDLQVNSAVYQKRWTILQDALVDLDSNALEAEALWGQTIKDRLQPLNKCISVLNVNLKKHLYHLRPVRKYRVPVDIEEKVDEIIYGFSGDVESNTFSADLEGAVKQVETFLKPRLKL